MNKTVGILGGMGPQATLDLMAKIVAATPARRESDHVRLLVDCNPRVPDRVAAIEGRGPDPGPVLAQMARGLVGQGAELLAVACNTAHYFLPVIQASVPVPVLDMIALTAQRVTELEPAVRSVGLLATTATIGLGLYHRPCAEHGLEVLTLDPAEQEQFMALAKGVKVGRVGPEARAAMGGLARKLLEQGAGVVIAGCTEVPLLLAEGSVVDPTRVLAEGLVKVAWEGAD